MEEEYIFPKTAKIAADIVKMGGKVGIGSHGEFQGLGYHWSSGRSRSGGMPATMPCAWQTIVGAQALGLDGDLGSLEPGKLADLIVLDRNPLESLRNSNSVRYVMKNGRLYEGDTVDEVWPRQRKTLAPYGLADMPKTAAGEKR
jgi:imidazolonepropionase-like amidohydrolase